MPECFRFGHFELHPVERRLLDDGRPVALGARGFDLLLALIERRDRLVTKAELLDLVWPGLVVEEANLPVQVSGLRRLLGAEAIATAPGRGYRFAMAIDGDPPTAAREAAAPAPLAEPAAHTNVPAAIDVLLGRESDIETLRQWLREHRLVTVLGAGGIGKTRLAQAVARAAVDDHADGVWWVDVAALSSADKVVPAIAGAAHVRLADGDAQVQLLRALAPRRMLLVLDNCEYLAAGIARIVSALLAGAAGVRVLTTSQEALKTEGEHLYLLSALAVPPVGVSLATARSFAAVQLLEHRARAADPRFVLSEATVSPAIELCRGLDGVALAIEMAAARLPLLGVQGLHRRLADRLNLLRTSSREVPSRQRTLRATLDWSHELLDANERAVLRRLAVFVGTFRLEAAQQTAAFAGLDADAVLDALVGLVDKSLVGIEQLDPPRYRLLETTRLYAQERLRDADEIEAAIRSHDDAMARVDVEPPECGAAEGNLLRLYAADHQDIAEAFDRAVARRDPDVVAATARTLCQLEQMSGSHFGTRAQVQVAIEMLSIAGPLARARLTSFIVRCAWISIVPMRRTDCARDAVRQWQALGDTGELHSALVSLAALSAREGRFDEAERVLSEAQPLERPDWPPGWRARRAFAEGHVANFRNQAQRCRACMSEAMVLYKAARMPLNSAIALYLQADAALMEGAIDEAVAICRRAVEELRRLDSSWDLGCVLAGLCECLLRAEDFQGAHEAAAQALPILDATNDLQVLCDQLATLGVLTDHHREATLMLGYVETWNGANHVPRTLSLTMLAEQAAKAIENKLGASELQRLRQAGAELDDAQVSATAREILVRPPFLFAGSEWPSTIR